MLVLSRKAGERIYIGDDIVVTVIASGSGKVRLGVVAPSHISIDREEVRLRKQARRECEWEIEPVQVEAVGAES